MAVAMTALCAGEGSLAAPACTFEPPETTVVAAPSSDEFFVRATSATYRCTGLVPDVYYYFCAGEPGAAASEVASADGTSRARLLNLFGQPLAGGDLLRAFRADGPAREETVPLFRLGIRPAPDAAARVEPSRGTQALDVVQGGTVFSSREGCATGRRVAQVQVAVALQTVRLATCEVSLSSQLAFGHAPPSWDALPDPASRLRLHCAAGLAWRASLDDGVNASGDTALRRRLAPRRLTYGVHVGAVGAVDFSGAAGYAGTTSVLMRGHVPGNPRAEGLEGQSDVLVTTLDF
jgi:hypothetical protein